jgi:hypothetical protein
MTVEASEIEAMAHEARCSISYSIYDDAPHSFLFGPAHLARFASLVEAATLERAAKIADQLANDADMGGQLVGASWMTAGAAAIRAAAPK